MGRRPIGKRAMTAAQRQRRRRARQRLLRGQHPEAVTLQQQWAWAAGYLLGDAVAMGAAWDRLFPGWREFRPPLHLLALAREAAAACAALADDLQRRPLR
jgi:hypothetical protein